MLLLYRDMQGENDLALMRDDGFVRFDDRRARLDVSPLYQIEKLGAEGSQQGDSGLNYIQANDAPPQMVNELGTIRNRQPIGYTWSDPRNTLEVAQTTRDDKAFTLSVGSNGEVVNDATRMDLVDAAKRGSNGTTFSQVVPFLIIAIFLILAVPFFLKARS